MEICNEQPLSKGSNVNAMPESDSQPIPDMKSLLEVFNDDVDFLKQMAEIFLSDAPPMLDTIKDAIQTKDADNLRRTAHSLKGMLKSFQFDKVARTAFQLEESGRQKVFDNSWTTYKKLARQLDKVYKMLSEITKDVEN